MAYPNTIDTYTPVAGTTLVSVADHANMHNVAGSANVALETVLGTTSGTSVLKNISVGQFAVPDSSGTLTNTAITTGTITTPVVKDWNFWATLAGTAQPAYVSGSVISAPGTILWTNYLQVGDRIGFSQGGTSKYFDAAVVGTTNLTLNAGTLYTVANAAITGFQYSKGNPQGHPVSFPTSGTFNATSGTITSSGYAMKHWLIGKIVNFNMIGTVTTNGNGAGVLQFPLPIPTTTANGVVHGRENGLTGRTLNGVINATNVSMTFYDNAYAGTSVVGTAGVYLVEGNYELN